MNLLFVDFKICTTTLKLFVDIQSTNSKVDADRASTSYTTRNSFYYQ